MLFHIISLNDLKFLRDVICRKSQDMENGGISDRPDDAVDVYHTYFGVAGKYMLHDCLPNFVVLPFMAYAYGIC